ncbi:Spore germination protein GerE [compost metagenome]
MYSFDEKVNNVIQKISLEARLSKREFELLSLWVSNYDYKQISSQLVISQQTVRKHIHNINLKLGTHSKYEILLIIIAYLSSQLN